MPGNKRGFSLTELMMAIALLSIIIALSFQAFSHLYKTYERTHLKWLTERQINFVMGEVEKAVRLSYAVELSNTPPAGVSETRMRIYQSGNGIYILNPKSEVKDAIRLNEASVDLLLSAAMAEDGGDGEYSNAVQITLSSPHDYANPLSTVISLPNIQGKISTQEGSGAAPYTVLSVTHVGDYSYVPEMNDPATSGCFIATAAYGDYEQSSVLLLRSFRDGVLMKTAPGREFVKLYYSISPPVAAMIAGNDALCLMVRLLLLPFIGVAAAIMHPMFAFCVCAVSCASYYLIRRRLQKSGVKSP